jgi:hypothetical protein
MSRRYRLPFRRVKGRALNSSLDGGSLVVTAVIPLDPVVLEMLLDLPSASPLAAAAAALCSAATWRACLRSAALVPEFEEFFRFAAAA